MKRLFASIVCAIMFVAAGVPATCVPYAPSSVDPLVFFPTVSAGFNMALF